MKLHPEAVDWARLVTVDFETYFDTHYTLRKMSTSEYVRDERFKAQMVGIKIGKGKTKVYGPKQLKRALQAINWSTHSLLCHNTAFDGFILHHHFQITPARYYDTLSMARGLHSNEIGAGLDDVAMYYGKGSKIEGVLDQTKGVLDWPKELYDRAAGYCAQDVDLTYEIFKEMHAGYPSEEMELIHMTIKMFCDPVLKVDIPRVEAEYAREIERREKLFFGCIDPGMYDIGGKLYDKELHKKLIKGPAERALEGTERGMHITKRLLGNNEFYADLLRAEGIEPPTKVSKAWMSKDADERDDDDKHSYAFAKDDAAFTGLPDNIDIWRGKLSPSKAKDVPAISAKQDRIRNLVDARLAVKSTTNITRAERFLEAGKDGMPLPVGYAYYRAHTGRFGGNNKMNMQNLTRGGELRLSILAPEGHQLAVVDSGQIEARVNGWLWGQDDLMDAFRKADTWDKSKGVAHGDNRDAYCRFGDSVYGREITTEDKMERFVGKVCVLGLGFQMGAPKFQMTLAKGALGGPPVFFDIDECHRIVNTYRDRNHKIRDGWGICSRIIEDMAAGRSGSHKCISWEKETIWLPNGMPLKYPDPRSRIGEKGWVEWSYQAGDMRSKIYGGLLCLGAKTQVLTDNGWKTIISVRLEDKLWDGTNWVSHSGLVHQGVKETINFGGVDMTPDHEVLVDNHWFAAKETSHHEATSSFARHYRAPDRHVDSSPDVRQARRQQQDVFDLIDAGPLRRFTVRGDDGQPFIVHNCENIVQALARIIVATQMVNIGKKYRVVMTTHDEVVALSKTREAQKCFDYMMKCMTTAPWWCRDIPLNAEGGWSSNYSK